MNVCILTVDHFLPLSTSGYSSNSFILVWLFLTGTPLFLRQFLRIFSCSSWLSLVFSHSTTSLSNALHSFLLN